MGQVKVKARCGTCGSEGFEYIDHPFGPVPEIRVFHACTDCTPYAGHRIKTTSHTLRFDNLTTIGHQIEVWLSQDRNLVQGIGL